MGVEFWLKGKLDSVKIEEDFDTTMSNLNLANATGKEFAAFHTEDGKWCLVKLGNIAYAEEAEPEFPTY
jgi:hypothetical protein